MKEGYVRSSDKSGGGEVKSLDTEYEEEGSKERFSEYLEAPGEKCQVLGETTKMFIIKKLLY